MVSKKPLTPEIMFHQRMRRRPQYVVKEARITLQLILWRKYKMSIYDKVERSDVALRFRVDKAISDALYDGLMFINNSKERDYNKGVRSNRFYYDGNKISNGVYKKVKTPEEVVLDYGLEGVNKEIALLIMEGLSDKEIKLKLKLSKYFYKIRKKEIMDIIKGSNE